MKTSKHKAKSDRIRNRMREMRFNFFENNPNMRNSPVFDNTFEMMNRFIDGVPDERLVDALKSLSKMFVKESSKINDFVKDKNGGVTP